MSNINFASTPQPPGDPYSQPQYQQPQPFPRSAPSGGYYSPVPVERPINSLVWSIFGVLFGGLIFGGLALLFHFQGDTAYKQGDTVEGLSKSKLSRLLAIIGIGLNILVFVGYLVLADLALNA